MPKPSLAEAATAPAAPAVHWDLPQHFHGVSQRRELAPAALEAAGRAAPRAALLAIREGRLVGWQAVGVDPTAPTEAESIRDVDLDVDGQSILGRTLADGGAALREGEMASASAWERLAHRLFHVSVNAG